MLTQMDYVIYIGIYRVYQVSKWIVHFLKNLVDCLPLTVSENLGNDVRDRIVKTIRTLIAEYCFSTSDRLSSGNLLIQTTVLRYL